MAGETLPSGSTNTQGLADWASPYITDYLGKAKALSETPYQVYKGPLTAGASPLQEKMFQGVANLAFPSNLGQSFSSTGAYQAPQLNMDTYMSQPIGLGNKMGRPTYEQYQASLPAGQQPQVNKQAYDAGLAGEDIYGGSRAHVMPQKYDDGLSSLLSSPMFQNLNLGGSQPQIPSENIAAESPSPNPQPLGTQASQPIQSGLFGLSSGMQQPQQAPGIAAQYMNPYLQSVLTPQLEELRRQNDITNMNTNAMFTKAGAFGGGRQAIMNAENNRNLMQEMNKTVGQGYSTAFDKAMGQFNTEQGQAKDVANLIGNTGAQERGITAEGIAADKAEFETQRQFPFQQVQFQRDMISGLPTGSVTNTPANLTGMGSFLSALGGGTAAASALGYKNVGELLKGLGLDLGPQSATTPE